MGNDIQVYRAHDVALSRRFNVSLQELDSLEEEDRRNLVRIAKEIREKEAKLKGWQAKLRDERNQQSNPS